MLQNEQSVIDRVVSRGYIRNGGAAHRFNTYPADGTLFDWLSSVGVPYSFVLESFGEPDKGPETTSMNRLNHLPLKRLNGGL